MAVLLGIMVTEAALETGFVYALRVCSLPPYLHLTNHTRLTEHAHGLLGQPAYREGKESAKRGVQFFGILSSVMISLALL